MSDLTLTQAITALEAERDQLAKAVDFLRVIEARLTPKTPAPAKRLVPATGKRGRGPRLGRDAWTAARRRYEVDGWPAARIAKELGKDLSGVYRRARREGWTAPAANGNGNGKPAAQRCPSCGRAGHQDPCEHCFATRP